MQALDTNPRRDLLIGFLGFIGANLILCFALYLVAAALPRALAQSSAVNTGTIFLFCCFPGLVNIGAEIFLFVRLRWVALGVLLGVGAAIILASIGMAVLIASGFTLV